MPKPVRPPGPRRGLRLAVGLLVLAAVVGAGIAFFILSVTPAQDQARVTVDAVTLADLQGQYASDLASAMTDPSARAQRVTTSAQAVLQDPASLTGKTLKLRGTLASDVVDSDDGAAFFVLLADGMNVPALYPGVLDAVAGDQLEVTGEVGPNGGVRADRVRAVDSTAQLDEWVSDPWRAAYLLAWATVIALGLLLAASLLLLARKWNYNRGLKRAAERVAVAVALVVFLGLAGCTVDIHTTIREDGSGTLVMRMTPPSDKGKVSDLTNSDAYVRSMKANMAEAGTKLVMDGETFVFTREFSSPAQLSGVKTAGGGYTNLTVERDNGVTHYVFTARIDTRDLYAADGEMAPEATDADMLRDELDKTEMTYALDMPGELRYTNGSASGATVTWTIPMNAAFDLRAESVIGTPIVKTRPDATPFLIWAGAIGLIVLLALVLLVVAVAWYPNPKAGRS